MSFLYPKRNAVPNAKWTVTFSFEEQGMAPKEIGHLEFADSVVAKDVAEVGRLTASYMSQYGTLLAERLRRAKASRRR